MKTIASRRNVWILALGASLLAACSGADSGPDSSREQAPPAGKTTDPGQPSTTNPSTDPGSITGPMQSRALVSGRVTNRGVALPGLGLGGSGMLDAAVKVQLSKVLAGGKLEVVGSANVGANGEFSLAIPLNLDLVIAQVLDANGKVLGSGILGASGKVDGQVLVMAPIDIETSLEASVLLQVGGCQVPDIGTATQVAAGIDAKLAAEISAGLAGGLNAHVALDALVQATLLAGKVKAQIVASAGVEVDVQLLAELEAKALAKLNAGLSAAAQGQANAAEVTAQFLADLDAALKASASLDAHVSAKAQIGASIGFANALAASLSVNVTADVNLQALVFASVRTSALVEAEIAASTVLDAVKASGAPPAIVDATGKAGLELLADIDAAVNVDALNLAKLKFMATINANAAAFNPLGTLLGGVIGTLEGLVKASAFAQAELEAQLRLALCASVHVDANAAVCVGGVGANASVSLDLQAKAVIDALAKLSADISALGGTPASQATLQIGSAANGANAPVPQPFCPSAPDGGPSTPPGGDGCGQDGCNGG